MLRVSEFTFSAQELFILGVRRFYVPNAVQGQVVEIDNARLGLLYVSESYSGRCGLYLIGYTSASLVFATTENTLPWTVSKDRTTNIVSITRENSGTGHIDALFITCRV